MRSTVTALTTALEQTTRYIRPRVYAEFDYNRIADTVTADNIDQSTDDPRFPIASMLEMKFEPKSGLPKGAIDGSYLWSKDSTMPRPRVSSEDDVYKYYRGGTISTGGGGLINHDIFIDYDEDLSTNKIKIVFETSFAAPTNVNMYVDPASNPGVLISIGSFVPDADGIIELWHQGSNVWSTTTDLDNAIDLRGFRFVVTEMGEEDAHCDIHYASMLLDVDMSDRVISMDIDRAQEGALETIPVAGMILDQASLEFENADGAFDPDNTNGFYYNLQQYRIKFQLGLEFKDATDTWQYLNQGIFYSDSWSPSPTSAAVSLSLHDVLVGVQEAESPELLLKDYKVTQAIREVLAASGFFGYSYSTTEDRRLEYFWSDGEGTLFDAVNELIITLPGAVTARDNGDIEFMDWDWQSAQSYDIDVSSDTDLISLDHEFTLQANKITVSYNKYTPLESSGTILAAREKVWEPDAPVLLKSVDLAESVLWNDTTIPINLDSLRDWLNQDFLLDNGGLSIPGFANSLATSQDVFDLFPEKGMVAIGNERIKYTGKSNVGGFFLTGAERGYYGAAVAHSVYDYSGEAEVFGFNPSRSRTAGSGIVGDKLRLNNGNGNLVYNWHYAEVDYVASAPASWRNFGVSVKILDGLDQRAGVMFNKTAGGHTGYCVELVRTSFGNPDDYTELIFYKITEDYPSGPEHTALLADDVTGLTNHPVRVATGVLHDIDVVFVAGTYTVYLDGQKITSVTDSTYTYGGYGAYARSKCNAEFQHMYFSDDASSLTPQYNQKYDPRTGTYSSNMNSALKRRSIADSTQTYFVEEFGPAVREVYEIKGRYNKTPVVWASLYVGNESEVDVIIDNFSNFRFHIMVETVRESGTFAALNTKNLKEDTGEEEELVLTQAFFIVGQPIASEEGLEYIAENTESIRKVGKRVAGISGPWIQGLESATLTGDFAAENWGEPTDSITVDWVPNPKLEVGDIVRIDYPERNYTAANNVYYVTGTNISFDGALTGSLTLKRKVV